MKYKSAYKIFLLLSAIAYSLTSFSQSFTKITANPIVNDFAESGGASWIDMNNDGLLDLFVSRGNLTNQNNAMFLNLGSGNFKKVTTGSIVTDGGSSIGSTWGDFNNDGFIDCFVTNRNNFGNFLYVGKGDSVYTKITAGTIVIEKKNSNSSSWVDINNDGNLDLFIVNFGESDLMYANEGPPGYSFTKDSLKNIIEDSNKFSIPGAWADYNNDLLPDLFKGNSGTQNDNLYTSNGNFSFLSSTLFDSKATLGASWADYDNDGDLDLYVCNFLGGGNILYRNSGAPSYSLVPLSSSVLQLSGNFVGSTWGDVDNDGDLDLFIAQDDGLNQLFLNSGFPSYEFTAEQGQTVNEGGNSFGCVFGDYDNDGQLDLFVANRLNQKSYLYKNTGNSNHWITIKCEGTNSNRSGIGAKVFIKANINGDPIWQMQEVAGQTGYNSQNLWLHFGLANASSIDSIRIVWPSGTVDICTNILPDQIYKALEGNCIISKTNSISNNNINYLLVSPNPSSTETIIKYSLKERSDVELKLFDSNGKIIRILSKESKNQGDHEFRFINNDLPEGIYYIHLGSNNNIRIKKLILFH